MNEMNIESAQYIADIISGENSSVAVVINGVSMSVPLDPSNRHYAEILQQVAEGVITIQEAE